VRPEKGTLRGKEVGNHPHGRLAKEFLANHPASFRKTSPKKRNARREGKDDLSLLLTSTRKRIFLANEREGGPGGGGGVGVSGEKKLPSV